MLKLTASFSKKVPADQEFSSKGYSATIEVEIPEGLNQEQLQGRVHETFQMVETSVESELNKVTTVQNTQPAMFAPQQNIPYQPVQPSNQAAAPTSPVQQTIAPATQYAQPPKPKSQKSRPASAKQLKYLTDVANKKHIVLTNYLPNYGVARVEDLNSTQCSQMIDMLNSNAA